MRNVILQIKGSPRLVLSLFMRFHFPLQRNWRSEGWLNGSAAAVQGPLPSLPHLSPSNVTKFLSGTEAQEIKSKYCNQEAAGEKMRRISQ